MKFYVAELPTYYELVGIGRTPEEAKKAVCREYRRSRNSGYGLVAHEGRLVRTDAQIERYFGIPVYGPLALGEATTR